MNSFYDVIVVGGGPSGVPAAISAARLGAKVLLIERYGFLGGMNTAGLVGPIMTFHAGKLQIVKGIGDEIIQETKRKGGTPGYVVDPIWANTSMCPVDTEVYKEVLIEKIKDSGVTLLLHSFVVDVVKENQKITQVCVAGKSGMQKFSATTIIDATGDGDLAARAGCTFHHGRKEDQLTQPMTLMFKMSGVDEDQIRNYIRKNPEDFYLGFPVEEYLAMPSLGVSGFFSKVKEGKERGLFPFDRDRVLFFSLPRKGDVTLNTLRITHVSGTSAEDLTKAESTLRTQVSVLENFLKECIPGFQNAYVTETATQVGVRETRHIVGEYTLTAQDILDQRKFKDVVAHASYPIDIHSPSGTGMQIQDPRKNNPESFYDIPLRCLLPKGLDNVLITGRCISAEHEASASARISATCMALGEAAGVVGAFIARDGGSSVRDVSVQKVQEQLVKQGAFLVVG